MRNARGKGRIISMLISLSFHPSPEYLTYQLSLAITISSYVFPMKTIGGDIRENPISVFFGMYYPDEFIALFGESQPFHRMVAGIYDIVMSSCFIEHSE